MKTCAFIEYLQGRFYVRVNITEIEKFDAETICFLQELAREIESAKTIDSGLLWDHTDTSVLISARLAEQYTEMEMRGIREQLNFAICSCFGELPVRIAPHPNPESLM